MQASENEKKEAGNIKFKIKLKIKITSSQTLRRVKWQAVTDVSMNHNALNFRGYADQERGEILRGLFDPENESTAIVRNVCNFTSRHGVNVPATSLREPQI